MSKNKSKSKLQVRIGVDKTVIPIGKSSGRILEITLIAPPAPEDRPHIPLNMSLVIDRSGSMQGDKLHYVKQAAAHVIDLLSEKDRLAVVAYDDKVTTLMGSQLLTKSTKKVLIKKIMALRAGASTFLYGGWLAGCRHVAEAISDESVNRTLLLSDGLANVGERNIDALSLHAQELFQRKISTSCFGVGLNYDEHLMESMATHGGGSFHFLETLQAIPLVFEREFDELLSVSLRDLSIILSLPENVEAKVSANWQAEREGHQLTLFLGNLVAEQTKNIYLRLDNLQGEKGKTIEIPVVVKGVDRNQVEHRVKNTLILTPVTPKKADATSPDSELLARYAAIDLADKANEALKRERAGDRTGSASLMQGTLHKHQAYISDQDQQTYTHFTNEIQQGLSEAERKRHHYMEFEARRGQQSIRHHPIHFLKGALVADIQGQTVLINTGARESLGARPGWRFLHQVYRLRPEGDRIHINEVSKLFGTPIDVMLGMDILRDLYLQIELQRMVVTFKRTPFQAKAHSQHMLNMDPTPTLDVLVAGTQCVMRLMTGTGISLVPPNLLPKGAAKEQIEVAIPGLPAFTASIFNLPIDIAGQSVSLKCAALPESVRSALGLGPEEGILGAELFQKLPVTLEFPRQRLSF